MIQGVEAGKNILSYPGQLIYLLVWIVGLWTIGSLLTAQKAKEGTV